MEWDKVAKTISAGVAGITTFVLGEPNVFLQILIVMVIADYASGVIAAIVTDKLNSEVGFKGILKKAMYFFVVLVAHCVDTATGADGVLRNVTIGFLIANEGISILENTSRCGVPWPKKLKDVLEQLRDENNKPEDISDDDNKM